MTAAFSFDGSSQSEVSVVQCSGFAAPSVRDAFRGFRLVQTLDTFPEMGRAFVPHGCIADDQAVQRKWVQVHHGLLERFESALACVGINYCVTKKCATNYLFPISHCLGCVRC